MKTRIIVGIVFLALSVVGISCGVWGAVNKQVKVSGPGYSGVYDLDTKSYNGTVAFSMSGGISGGFKSLNIDEKALLVKNCRTWGGFGSAALYAFIGVSLVLKGRRRETAE